MQKKLIAGGVAGLIVIGIFFFLKGNTPSANALVGESLLVTTYTDIAGESTTHLLQVPFLRGDSNAQSITISIDLNGDGSFTEDERLVSNAPVNPQADWYGGYYAVIESGVDESMQAEVVVDGAVYQTSVTTKTIDMEPILDLASITDPENATKGLGITTAHAAEGEVTISTEGVPDLNQRTGECAPTAAANSLISLVAKNGGDDLIPGDPLDFIENLKRHMNWTAENGVPPDDFVAGKNRWAAAAGVPIKTTKVGDTQGVSTIDAIREALENGDAVELRIRFTNPEGTKITGGHMVTVTGIHQGEGQTYLEINDPGTHDSGTEMVEIRGNRIVNYSWSGGLTLLSWGFVQSWEGHPTGELLDTMTDEEIAGIRQFAGETPMITVIAYNGKYLPVSQLMVVEDEIGCKADHWHAISGSVTATDGTDVPDPGPQCGYGKVADVPSQNIPAPNNND